MRITKLGAAALAATLTFGGAALAFADDAMPADPTLQDGTTTTTTVVDEPAATTTTVAGEDESEDVGEGDSATHEHPDNHGKIVSQAAHDTPPGPGHGKAVSEVARSTNHGHTKTGAAEGHKKSNG
jgi:hypothetical protein